MRAVSKDFETSQLMGVKINSVISVTFVIGSFLAAIGSILYFTNYNTVIQTSGAMPGLKAFVAAVFGGIGSVPGAVVGAFIIGICESIIKGLDIILLQAGLTTQMLGLSTFSDAFSLRALDRHPHRQAHRPVRREDDRQGLRRRVPCRKHLLPTAAGRTRPRGSPWPSSPRCTSRVRTGTDFARHLHALYRAEKGRDLRPGGGVHEPAQRLYRPVLAGAGGLHAHRRLYLRHLLPFQRGARNGVSVL